MREFDGYNPISIFIYFAAAAILPMFFLHPLTAALMLFGGVGFFFSVGGWKSVKSNLFFMFLALAGAFINPLFNHNGATVLFVLNDNPVTLEAFWYGLASSALIIGGIFWFRAFSKIMTSDKLLYLLGTFSPKIALILSMALRYIPLFAVQAEKTSDAQKALGLAGDGSVPERLKSGIRVFSVMVTWTLENGIVTADSMEARGYGSGKRTFFSVYRFHRRDYLLVGTTAALFAVFAFCLASGAFEFSFYPYTDALNADWRLLAGTAAYGPLAFLPVIIKGGEAVKWRYLRSEI